MALLAIAALSASVAAGCGGDDADPYTPTGVLRPAETGSFEASPEAVDQTSWADEAEDVVRSIIDTREDPPVAESGDVDDDMMLVMAWHGALVSRAVEALTGLDDAPDGATALVEDLERYSGLELEAAKLYNEQMVFSESLTQITTELDQLEVSIDAQAANLDVPAVADLIDL